MRVRIGDVATIVAKQVDPRLPEHASLPLINGENIESGTTRLVFRRTAADQGVVSPKYEVATGDIVYSKLRPYLRKVVVATEPGLCSADCYPLRADPSLVDAPWMAWMLVSDRFTRFATDASVRARMPKLNREQLFAYEFALPALEEQRSVAARLNDQLDEVARVRAVEDERGKLSRRMGLFVLAEAFLHGHSHWPRRYLGEITTSRRSPSATSDGDIGVTTVTSGCLTPFGFSFGGLGFGRMSSRDAIDGVIAADEVLVSRSNTEDLVGRASRYPGGPNEVVASDLVFRLAPNRDWLTPDYLAGYLSVIQLQGYWRDRSSGASSTMKKITKSLLLNVGIPLPPLEEQLRITAELRRRLATTNAIETAIRAEREAIEALPAALLRRAFEDAAA